MKAILTAVLSCIVFIFIFIPATGFCFDADIYAGYYFDSTYKESPGGDTNAKFLSGVKVGHDVNKLRAYLKLETIYDQYNGDGTLHPASIKYFTGLTYKIIKDLTVTLEHMCWHPIDVGGDVEQYNLIKVNYHFE